MTLKQIAKRYLERRGYIVLPLTFQGVVLGNCNVNGTHRLMSVSNPSGFYIALNHSTIYFNTEAEGDLK